MHLLFCKYSVQVARWLFDPHKEKDSALITALHPGTISGVGSDSRIISGLLANEYGFLIPKPISKCILEGHTEMKPASQS